MDFTDKYSSDNENGSVFKNLGYSDINNFEIINFYDKIMYSKNQHIKYNFRENLSNHDLDEGIIINFPYQNTYRSFKSNTTSIPLSQYFKRAGVIPYTLVKTDNGFEKCFCMGIDSNYGSLTDFGGGCKHIESFTRAASRELYEESLGIFNISSKKLYNSSFAVYDPNMIIMFVRVDFGTFGSKGSKSPSSSNPFDLFDYTVKNFQQRYSKVVKSENSNILWVHEDIFFSLVKSGKSLKDNGCIYPSIYKPVCDLLRSVSNLNDII